MLTYVVFFFLLFHVCCCCDCCPCGAFSTGNVIFSLSFYQPYLCYATWLWPANSSVKDISYGCYLIDMTSPRLWKYILFHIISVWSCTYIMLCFHGANRDESVEKMHLVSWFCNSVWDGLKWNSGKSKTVTLRWYKNGCRGIIFLELPNESKIIMITIKKILIIIKKKKPPTVDSQLWVEEELSG